MNRKRFAAAKKGWETRRANQRKRSAAAKKGWETRRANQRKTVPPKLLQEQEMMTRKSYKRKQGKKIDHVDIVHTGPLKEDLSNVKQLKINGRVYTRRKDIERFHSVITAAL